MIRITELKLPLAQVPFEQRRDANAPPETEADRQLPPHPTQALRSLSAQALGLSAAQVAQVQVFKRSFDARKSQLQVVYIVDVSLVGDLSEAAVLQRFSGHPHISASPPMDWQGPIQAPADRLNPSNRPVVVGFGPCGMFAAEGYANAPKTPGGCGANSSFMLKAMCNLAKVVRARFQMASCTVKSKTHATWDAR